MMRMRYLLLAALLAGCCSTHPRTAPPAITSIVWIGDFKPPAVRAWESQIRSRFGNRQIVALFCHGSETVPWQLHPDKPRKPVSTALAASVLRNLYPDALIVLIVCNPHHERIDVPGVAYALDDVWITPGADDRWVWFDSEHAVGSINEFIVNP